MRLVVDTNVLVSVLLHPGRVPDRMLAALWAQRALVLYDARVLNEYRTVLGRPKFHSIERRRTEELLETLLSRGEDLGVVAPWEGSMMDESDRMFVEVALAGRAVAIVTGNVKHYPSVLGFEVLPPATLLARLELE
jgi:putative PIN family toxin of toxin-antitoxin system